MKQTLETFREEDLRESEGVLGKAFERLKMAFLVIDIDMAAMVTRVVCCFPSVWFHRFQVIHVIRCSRRIRWQPTGLTHQLPDATCWTLLFLCRLGGQHMRWCLRWIKVFIYLLFLFISKDFLFCFVFLF